MLIDSTQQQLDMSQIIMLWLQNNPQKYPNEVVLPAITKELSMPEVKTVQIGNTVFEVIHKNGDTAFFKAFNADIATNFLESSKEFVRYAKNELSLKTLVTQFSDPTIEKLFHAIAQNPPMEGMGYRVLKMQSGETRIVLNLGGEE